MPDVSLDSLDSLAWVTNGLVLAGAVAAIAFLSRASLRNSSFWRATVTPLASIIGSGFLVVAPLLGSTVGRWAFLAMLGIVALAYAVGGAVRYNIENVEEISEKNQVEDTLQYGLKWMERAAKLVLALAYVIAITFYLELLAAFVLQLFDVDDQSSQKAIATALVIFIGAIGFWRGLRRLEALERYSVDLKLAIIVGFLVGLVVVNADALVESRWALAGLPVDWSVETVRKVLGAFLIVQGFETSRYMGNAYSAGERVATMRYAQILSAVIYAAFIGLASILLGSVSSINETGIITLSAQVAFIVPFMLVVGAVAAQFSAAVADTLASGGLVEAATYGKLSHRYVYLAVMVVVVTLLWTSHIFGIIAYASRAFAAYYALQCIMASTYSAVSASSPRHFLRAFWFALLALSMTLAAIFGIPAESVGN